MRRAFQFRLARVQRVREVEERLARAAWREAETGARAAATRRETTAQALGDARQELVRRLQAGPVDSRWLEPAHTLLGNGVVILRRVHEEARTLAERARLLAEAWRAREADRRALEKLAERARARHRLELERSEGLEQDERTLARAAQRAAPPARSEPVKLERESADQA